MKASKFLILGIAFILALSASYEASAKPKTVQKVIGEKTPTKKKEQLIWNVNQAITGFRVEIKAGRPIINEIRFLGRSEKWTVGRYFNAGQVWETKLESPVQVGQLRVNTDKAVGSRLRLIVYTKGLITTRTGVNVKTKSGEVAIGTHNPTKKKENVEFHVNRAITGFRVEIKKGRPIINEVKIYGGKKFTVGKYFNTGEKYEQRFASTKVGILRVNLDKAIGSSIRLVVYTGSKTAKSNDTKDNGRRIKTLNKDAEKKLDDMFKGFQL